MATRLQDSLAFPAHVPQNLVRSIGLTASPEFLAAPHAFMAGLHDSCPPIFYDVHPAMGGAWQVIGHADALQILRQPEYFSTRGATPFPRDPDHPFKFIPLEIDPPDHRKYRAILDPLFSPQGVQRLEGMMRELANSLIDRFIDHRECEFTTEFGRPMPVTIFLRLMGLPVAMTDVFVNWAVDLLHSQDRALMAETMKAITVYLNEAIAEKKAHPDEGVISRIAHAAPGGVPLNDSEIFGFVIFLFIGGLDTVFATLNNIWLWLARNPARRREIIARPQDINAIVEELLRAWSVTFAGRTVEKEIELHGVRMLPGDKVACILPACNFDPHVFANPTVIDFDRPRRPTLAFTVGVHSCMGAHLARLEIKVSLQEWLKRIPDFAVKPGCEIAYRPGGVIGPKALQLVW